MAIHALRDHKYIKKRLFAGLIGNAGTPLERLKREDQIIRSSKGAQDLHMARLRLVRTYKAAAKRGILALGLPI